MTDIGAVYGPLDGTTNPGDNISTPAQWAQAQLAYMGLPATQANIDFLVQWASMEGGNWENTARFNPLNTTLQYAGSSVMSGGNTAGVQSYGSWQDGLAATAQTLQGYPEILRALSSGNASQANSAGQLAGDLSRWSGGGYTQIGGNTSYGGTTGTPNAIGGGTVGTASQPVGSSTQPPPNVANDPALLDQWIQQNQPSYAWLLQIPELKPLVEQQISAGNVNQLMPMIEQTAWWKTTSNAVRTYYTNLASDPGDYSFGVPGSTASQTLANIMNDASAKGVTLSAQQGQTIATDAMKYGWSQSQIDQAVGSMVTYSGQGPGNAGGVVQQLKAMAGQYLQDVSPQVLQSWAQNVAAGTQTMQQFQSYLANNASLKWTGMASQIQQGYTPDQIVDNMRQTAAKTMEVDPNSIDFVNNPVYSKILDFVPPDSPNGVHRMMTQSEMSQYLKSQPEWGYTQQARDSAAQLEQTLATTWGKIA